MDLALRIGGALIGLAMVLAFLRSMLQVPVVNRQTGDWLARRVGYLVYTTIAGSALRRRSYDQIQDKLAWILPVYILLLIPAWFALVQAGFSLLIWSSQAEHSLLQAVIASGSALSTLGFRTPPDISGQLLAVPEGAMGWVSQSFCLPLSRAISGDPSAGGKGRVALCSDRRRANELRTCRLVATFRQT